MATYIAESVSQNVELNEYLPLVELQARFLDLQLEQGASRSHFSFFFRQNSQDGWWWSCLRGAFWDVSVSTASRERFISVDHADLGDSGVGEARGGGE